MQVVKKSVLLALAMMMILSSMVFTGAMAASPTAFDINDCEIVRGVHSGEYNGHLQSAEYTLTYNGRVLIEGVDYEVKGNRTSTTKPGKYSLTVIFIGKGAYSGFKMTDDVYTIRKASQAIDVPVKTKVAYKKTLKNKNVVFRTYACSESGKLRLINRTGIGFTIAKNGNILIPKGTKAGSYTLYLQAPATTCYKQSRRVRLTVRVK